MGELRVLYDGWPLKRAAGSPAAQHLLTLLALLPPQVEAVVALPESLAPGETLPGGAAAHVQPAPPSEAGRLRWEQRMLPGLRRELGADLLHLTSLAAGLFGAGHTVWSPSGYSQSGLDEERRAGGGLAAHLRDALAQGGLVRLRGLLWPADLPDPAAPAPLLRLPPVVHPAFWTPAGAQAAEFLEPFDLPEGFILYHGPTTPTALRSVLEAWSWAAGAIGEHSPLLLLEINAGQRPMLEALTAEYGVGPSVRGLPPLTLPAIAALYRRCTALFHPAGVSPWGGPLRAALACGRPIVGLENPLSDALLGPAAYLVKGEAAGPEVARALGAALITVVVEESVAQGLEAAARRRSEPWRKSGFAQKLLEAYQFLTK